MHLYPYPDPAFIKRYLRKISSIVDLTDVFVLLRTINELAKVQLGLKAQLPRNLYSKSVWGHQCQNGMKIATIR